MRKKNGLASHGHGRPGLGPGDSSLCSGELTPGSGPGVFAPDDSELDQREWWPGPKKEDTARRVLGRLSFWLSDWCRSVQELISLEERRGSTEPCCSGAGGACDSCFKGFCPDPFGVWLQRELLRLQLQRLLRGRDTVPV